MRFAEIQEIIRFPETSSYLLFIRVEYSDAEPEVYLLTLTLARGERAEQVMREMPEYVLCRVETPDREKGVLYSAMRNPEFCKQLLDSIARRRRHAGEAGELVASHTRVFRGLLGRPAAPLQSSVARGDHNNTPVLYDERFVLKLIRRVEPGIHPEREVGEFLTRHNATANTPPLAGALEYRTAGGARTTVAVLNGYVRYEEEAWRYTLDNLGLFFEQALALGTGQAPPPAHKPVLSLATQPAPDLARELMGSYLEMAALLGRRIAEVHLALASRPDDPDFAPEPFTDFYRQGLYHGLLRHMRRTLDELRRRAPALDPELRAECERLQEGEGELRERFAAIRDRRINSVRIRIHGDCNLDQVLFTGKDFVLIDFEGVPGRPISERRIKRSPLRDVASMLRSMHYASHAVLFGQVSGVVKPQRADAGTLERWADFWYDWAGAAFVKGYFFVPGMEALLPSSADEQRLLAGYFPREPGAQRNRCRTGTPPGLDTRARARPHRTSGDQMTRIPLATYRIQFNSSCRFVDGRDLVPYLHELGISDLYSSPWFKPRRGSSHGYDITDPFRVNSELGTEQEFGEMAEKLRHYGMGLLLDIVPNHMAASPENPWWMDVLENGPSSEFAVYLRYRLASHHRQSRVPAGRQGARSRARRRLRQRARQPGTDAEDRRHGHVRALLRAPPAARSEDLRRGARARARIRSHPRRAARTPRPDRPAAAARHRRRRSGVHPAQPEARHQAGSVERLPFATEGEEGHR